MQALSGASRRRGRLLPATCLFLSLVGCAPAHHKAAANAGEDEFDLITLASLDSIRQGATIVGPLPPHSYRWRPWWFRSPGPRRSHAHVAGIDSVLRRWIADSSGTKIDTLIITFVDHAIIPRFPEPDMQSSPLGAVNLAARAAASILIDGIEAQRDSQYNADTLALVTTFDAQILERYWIAQALRVLMPIGFVDSLAKRPDVVYIQRDHTPFPPPSGFDSNTANDADDGRRLISSDPYYDLGVAYGWISLLDTGVRDGHILFDATSRPFSTLGDCVDGDEDCVGGSSADVTTGHGTSSAALVAANTTDATLQSHRGVTAASLDVFRVYEASASGSGELVVSAALRGFQTATALLDRVIIAEMQDYSAEAAAIGVAADNAFAAGAVVVAANGNFASSSGTIPIGVPAASRRVLGVGARDMASDLTVASQSYGTTTDGRIKPDVQAPTNTESAGSTTDDAAYYLSATSGATPYVGAGAALIRNWMTDARGGVVDPGQVYAQLIASGRTVGPYAAGTKEGAGRIELPTNGWCYFGKVEITDAFPEVTIPLEILWDDIRTIEVALWWPETLVIESGMEIDTHNDINFELVDFGGTARITGDGAAGVFERGTTEVAVSDGTWELRIKGETLGDSPQTVYWTAVMRR